MNYLDGQRDASDLLLQKKCSELQDLVKRFIERLELKNKRIEELEVEVAQKNRELNSIKRGNQTSSNRRPEKSQTNSLNRKQRR